MWGGRHTPWCEPQGSAGVAKCEQPPHEAFRSCISQYCLSSSCSSLSEVLLCSFEAGNVASGFVYREGAAWESESSVACLHGTGSIERMAAHPLRGLESILRRKRWKKLMEEVDGRVAGVLCRGFPAQDKVQVVTAVVWDRTLSSPALVLCNRLHKHLLHCTRFPDGLSTFRG
jgi:hypothetical protein